MVRKLILVAVTITICITMFFTACSPQETPPQKRGEFYTLQEAYEQKLITQDELKSIAYYHNDESDNNNYEAIPKIPEVLSKETESAIKETGAYELRNQSLPIEDAKEKDIIIKEYLGTYNGCIAVLLSTGFFIPIMREETIAEVVFRYSDTNIIIIWKPKF